MTENLPIVVGVDGSRASEAAVQYAAHWALETKRPLRLVHVSPMYLPYAGLGAGLGIGLGAVTSLALPAEFKEVGVAILDAAAEQARAVLPAGQVTTQLLSGNATPSLRGAALHAHEVVLGADSAPAAVRFVTGSVVDSVAGEAVVPVTVIPESWTPDGPREDLVVVGIKDISRIPRQLLRSGFVAAREHHARLEFVHVWHMSASYANIIEAQDSYPAWQHGVEEEVRTVIGDLADEFSDVETTVHAENGDPSDVLRRHAANATLLLMGRSPHHLRHFGHTARKLLQAYGCPTEVVPLPRPDHDSGVKRSEPATWLLAQF